jgi:hypothetical protein
MALVGVACVAAAFAPRVSAAEERWEATSRTAMAITGNVTFSPTKVTFQNGKSLSLEAAGNLADLDTGGTRGPAVVYRVIHPENPVLLNGNTLCGKPATYIAVISAPQRGGRPVRSMEVSYGPPARAISDSTCGVFNYELVGGRTGN